MPAKLTTTLKNIDHLPNTVNIAIIKEFYQYMKDNGTSERHQNNNLKAIIAFSKSLDQTVGFHDIQRREQIISFLDTR